MEDFVYTAVLISAYPICLVTAGVLDLFTYSIPNRICLFLIVSFLIVAIFVGASASLVLSNLFAGCLLLGIGFAMFSQGWLGGGDAKLIASTALWIGLDHLFAFLLWTTILGGVLSVVVLVYRRTLPPIWLLRQPWAMRLHDPKEGIPYGVAIAGAGLIVYPETIWMTGIAG